MATPEDIRKIRDALLDSTTRTIFKVPTPGTARLSQAIISPLIKHVTEKYDRDKMAGVLGKGEPVMGPLHVKGTIRESHPVFKHKVASTAELLWGYHSIIGNTARIVNKALLDLNTENTIGDPLAFSVGFYYQKKEGDQIPPDDLIDTLHLAYNGVAVDVLNRRAIPLFGEKEGLVDSIGDETYVGGLKEPSLVASQISGWMFTRPTSDEARALFLVVKQFHEENITEKIKKNFTPEGQSETNDIRILRNIALQIITARKDTWGITSPEDELTRWMRDVDAPPVEAALGTREAVKDLLKLNKKQKDKIGKLSVTVKKDVETFFDKASEADTVNKAIESARKLLLQLMMVDLLNTKGRLKNTELNESLTDLTLHIARLKRQIQVECKKVPVKSKLPEEKVAQDEKGASAVIHIGSVVGTKLAADGDHLMSKHKRPQILENAFSKETIAHFDSILLSGKGKEIAVTKERDTPLNQWLL